MINISTLESRLESSLTRLAASSDWRQMFAENMNWSSCESLVQTSLLWSFNTQKETSFVADRERLLTGTGAKGTRPDLIVFRRSDLPVWKKLGATDRAGLRRMMVGCVYKKMVWANFASGAGSIPAKATGFVDDVVKARSILSLLSNEGLSVADKRIFGLLIISGFYQKTENGKADLDLCHSKTIELVNKQLQAVSQPGIRHCWSSWLLSGEEIPSQPDWQVFSCAELYEFTLSVEGVANAIG